MVKSLSNLHELRLQNTIDDHDLEQFPDTLRYLYLYSGYEQDLTNDTLIDLKQKNKRISSSPGGDDNNIQIVEMNPGRFGCEEPIYGIYNENSYDDHCRCTMFFKIGKGSNRNNYDRSYRSFFYI